MANDDILFICLCSRLRLCIHLTYETSVSDLRKTVWCKLVLDLGWFTFRGKHEGQFERSIRKKAKSSPIFLPESSWWEVWTLHWCSTSCFIMLMFRPKKNKTANFCSLGPFTRLGTCCSTKPPRRTRQYFPLNAFSFHLKSPLIQPFDPTLSLLPWYCFQLSDPC